MPDTFAPTLPTAEQVAALSPEARDTGRTAFVKAFPHAAAEIEQAFGQQAPAVSAVDPGHQAVPPVSNNPDSAISFEQRTKGLAALYKHGNAQMQATVLAQAKAAGIPLEKITGGEAPAVELLTRDQQADAANAANDPLSAPHDPSGYQLRFDPDLVADIPIEDLVGLDSDFREAFHTAGIPKVSAQGVLDGIADAVNLYPEGMTEAARQMMHREQGAILVRAHGQKGAEAILADATAAYNRLPSDFREMVDSQHGFHSAKAQIALAQAERAYRARRSKS